MGQTQDQPGRQAVVMVDAGGLDVAVVFVQAQVNKAGFGFVIPAGTRIAIPKFSGARVEGNAIQGDAEKGMAGGSGVRGNFGVSRQMKVVVLSGDGVWIAGSRKVARLMVRETVGANNAFTTGYSNGDAIGADAGFDPICVSAGGQRERDEEEQNSGEFRCNSHG